MPTEKQADTALLVSRILLIAPVKAVFLLGTATTQRRTASLFLDSTLSVSFTSHYYLLLLIEKDDDHTAGCIQDKIENSLCGSTPVTVIVLGTEAFLSWAGKGHYFATTVLRKAERLYVSNTLLLPMVNAGNGEQRRKENQAHYDTARSKVESFLAGADLYRIRKEYKLSAFMLHQAAEHSLSALLLIQTGYRANTHSLDKLLRYGSMCCPQLLDLFPKNSERSKKLYSLLQKAYIDSRYKDDYSINYDELLELTEKVKRIKQLFEQAALPLVCA